MTGRPPPRPLPPATPHVWRAGVELHRTHAARLRPAQFNPCLGQPTRFAPIFDPDGLCVSSLYAAASREAAAFETIFHDIAPEAAFKTVRRDVVTARSVSRIATRRDLKLAGLFAPDLHAWRARRTDVIETPKSRYAETRLWSSAIHDDFDWADGLVWTSRQCDPDLCVLLFGDRVSEADFDVVERREVASDPALLLELRGYGLRAGITIVS